MVENTISRLVVLGATGNVGLPIVKAALARKLKVLAVSRSASSKISIKDENLEVADIDLSKEGVLLDVLKSDDTVVFSAADHTGGQEQILRNVFKAFEEKAVKRIVHTAGSLVMKIDADTRLYDIEEVQKKYPHYAKASRTQFEVVAKTGVTWTEVAFGVVIPGSKTPESGTATFWGKEWKLIEFAKPLEDVEILSIPLSGAGYYILDEVLAEKILDVASKQVYLKQRIHYNNGLFAPK